MNKLKTILLSLLLSSTSIYAQKQFTVRGTIEGLADSMQVSLIDYEAESNDKRELGIGTISGNTFVVKGEIPSTHLCGLSVNAMNPLFKIMAPLVAVQFIAEGEDVEIKSALSVDSLHKLPQYNKVEHFVTVKGGKEQARYVEYLNAIRAQEDEYSRLNHEWALEALKHFGDNSMTTPKEDSLQVLVEAAQAKLTDATDAFIAAHPDYYISGHVTLGNISDVFKMTADEYRKEASKAHPADANLAERLNKRLEHSIKYALGTQWSDFKGNDAEGVEKQISALRSQGKYLLMDFWASWCGPCRRAIPRVKKILEDNSSRLDVISIDVDQKPEDWKKALAEEGMTWPQLRIAGEEAKRAFESYVIETIPRLVLVSPEGKILAVTHDPSIIEEKLKK